MKFITEMSMQPKIHELEALVLEHNQEKLKVHTINQLREILAGIKKRQGWIKIRNRQIDQLQVLKSELFEAYAQGDEEAMAIIAKRVSVIESAGCKEASAAKFASTGIRKRSLND